MNSTGGTSPSPSISRTFVPERNTRSSGPCGHDFVLAIEPQTLHQKVCSKNIGSTSSSCGCELVEDELRVVGAVVVAHARVVAADDEVRAAVVLAADRVPDRLARPRVAHRRRERGEEDAILGVVAVEQRPVALDANVDRHVVGLRVADERVDEQPVDRLERDLRQVLVRAVDRVAGLEADDALPATLGEDPPRLGGVARELGELGGARARTR